MSKQKKGAVAIFKLLDIMDELRLKCPWDKKQTLESLRTLTIEETYELSDAILADDTEAMEQELGDLLLHIVFYAKIGSETACFNWESICEKICEKLIRRHPHIYGDLQAADAEAVQQNWEKIKLTEGKKSVLEGVPKSLPSLVKAHRIQQKVSAVGFDWEHTDEVYHKIQEELKELAEAVQKNDEEAMESEMGDVFFSLINYARFLNINPDKALSRTNDKFLKRFQYIEKTLEESGTSIADSDIREMERLWKAAKKVYPK